MMGGGLEVTSRELKIFPRELRIFGEIDNFSSGGFVDWLALHLKVGSGID